MEALLKSIYVYCTDFIINLAHLFSISYYEVNFFVFCIIYPLFLLGSFTLYMIQLRRLRWYRKEGEK